VEYAVDALNACGKALKGSKVLVLGIAYKKNVDDMRESPALALMDMLQKKGAEIAYSDPHVPIFPTSEEHPFALSSIELTPETLGQFDCVLITTHHDRFDWPLIKRHAALIVDSRGVYREQAQNVIKA
jgi:UDP-N-acetyl-D-glucosamine dehydrogenase